METENSKWGHLVKRVFRMLLPVFVIYTAVGVLLFSCQSNLVYYPSRTLEGDPGAIGLEFEDVTIETSDNLELHGWFVPAKNERAVVLLCHGNAGNISNRLSILRLLHGLRFSIFIFDYRGFGRSEGSADEDGTYLDAEAAWKHLTEKRGIEPNHIVVLGRSLGGAIASHLAADHTPGVLIVDSSFTSLPDIGQEAYPIMPVKLLSRFGYPTQENVKKVRCPVLVIHSQGDEVIPFHHGREIFETAPEPKRFLEVSGGHNDSFAVSSKTYGEGIVAFVGRHIQK